MANYQEFAGIKFREEWPGGYYIHNFSGYNIRVLYTCNIWSNFILNVALHQSHTIYVTNRCLKCSLP